MNQLIICGRLTADPVIKTVGETRVANYSVAVDCVYNGNKKTEYFPVAAWGRYADFAEKYFCQGMRVLVSGRLQSREYTNRDGVKVRAWEVVAQDQEFADGKRDKGEQPAPAAASGDGFMGIPDDLDGEGLPFN